MAIATFSQMFHYQAPSLVVVFVTIFYCTALALWCLAAAPESGRLAAHVITPPVAYCGRPGLSWPL